MHGKWLGVSKLLSIVDKELSAKHKQLDTVIPKVAEAHAKVKGLQKRQFELEKSLSNINKDLEDQQTSIKNLNIERNALESMERNLKGKMEKASSEDASLKLDKAAVEEYSRLREEVSSKTAAERADELATEAELSSKYHQIQRLEEQQELLARDLETNDKINSEYEERLKNLGDGMSARKNEIDNLNIAKNKAVEDMKRSEQRIAEINAELEEINDKLRNVSDDRRRNKQEERISDAIETMKNIFKGVHGKMDELCSPIQKKYSQAL